MAYWPIAAYCRVEWLKRINSFLLLAPSRSILRSLALTAFFVSGCASAIGDGQQMPPAADAGTVDNPGADAALPPNTPDAAGEQNITFRATASDTIEADNSISCNSNTPDFFHAENKYYRTYSLNDLGVTTDLVVSSVDVGIQEATSLANSQPIRVTLYTLQGELLLANLTLLGAKNVDVADQIGTVLAVPMDDIVVPAGSILVVEVTTPDGQINSNRFFIGSNTGAEAQPSYLVAPSGGCAISEPTATALLGIPDLLMAIVLNVNGTHSSP